MTMYRGVDIECSAAGWYRVFTMSARDGHAVRVVADSLEGAKDEVDALIASGDIGYEPLA